MKIAHPSFEKLLTLSDLSKLQWQLLWIYDEPLGRSGRSGHYWNYPTAAWLIRRGTVRLRFGKDTETYHAGQWVFPRLAEGRQSFSRDAEILSVRFQLEWPDGTPLIERHRSLTLPSRHPTARALERAALQLLRFLRRYSPASNQRLQRHLSLAKYMEMQPFVARWITAFYRALAPYVSSADIRQPHEVVKRALLEMHSHALDQPFRLVDLAKKVGLSVSQLNKIFVQETGNTPAHFWQEKRLNIARSWLLHGADSVKVIAYNLGFSTPENFTHWFRARTHIAPKYFRESQQHL